MSAAPLIEQLSQEMGISTAAALFAGHEPHHVNPVLAPMFRRGGLPRGEVVSMTGARSLSCALATIAEVTRERRWCAGVGLGEPAISSLADLGVDLDHFVNVAVPAEDWMRVASILIESFDVILVDPGYLPGPKERARLLAKVRERRVSLISLAPFAGSSEQIEITGLSWSGTCRGSGRLRSCRVEARSKTGTHRFLLPGPEGGPALDPAPASAPDLVAVSDLAPVVDLASVTVLGADRSRGASEPRREAVVHGAR